MGKSGISRWTFGWFWRCSLVVYVAARFNVIFGFVRRRNDENACTPKTKETAWRSMGAPRRRERNGQGETAENETTMSRSALTAPRGLSCAPIERETGNRWVETVRLGCRGKTRKSTRTHGRFYIRLSCAEQTRPRNTDRGTGAP